MFSAFEETRDSRGGPFMLILGASSLHRATKTLKKHQQKRLHGSVITVPGLSFNLNAHNFRKTAQYYLYKYPNESIVVWNDVVNNSLSQHKSNGYTQLSGNQLKSVLSRYLNRIKSIIYCQRRKLPDVFQTLKKTKLPVVSIIRDILSRKKAKDSKFLRRYFRLHQPANTELKTFFIVKRHKGSAKSIIQKKRPPRLSKARRNRLKEQNRNQLQLEDMYEPFSDSELSDISEDELFFD